MLPKGSVMVKGCMTGRKRDQDGNPVGCANDNPILDTRSYIFNFDDGDQTEVTANMIAESLYSQCDPDGNQYVLLEEIVDHQRLPAAIKLSDQRIVRADGKTYLPFFGNFAANGKMALYLGRTLLTLRSLTLLKQLNMLRSLALTMNQLSTGGLLMP
jgi:hypothetical protein